MEKILHTSHFNLGPVLVEGGAPGLVESNNFLVLPVCDTRQ